MMNRSTGHRRVIFLKLSTVLMTLGLTLALTSAPAQVTFAQAPTPQALPAQATTADMAPLPMSPIEKAEKDGTALRLSLKDLTKLALQNNLDIAISDTNEELYQQRVLQTYGPYDPKFTAGLGVQSNKSANTRLDTAGTLGAGYNKSDSAYWNFGFTQNFKTGGYLNAIWTTNNAIGASLGTVQTILQGRLPRLAFQMFW